MSNKKGIKKLNRLELKKETVTDLEVQNAEQVKGGIVSNGLMYCPTKPAPPIGQPAPTRVSYTCPGK